MKNKSCCHNAATISQNGYAGLKISQVHDQKRNYIFMLVTNSCTKTVAFWFVTLCYSLRDLTRFVISLGETESL